MLKQGIRRFCFFREQFTSLKNQIKQMSPEEKKTFLISRMYVPNSGPETLSSNISLNKLINPDDVEIDFSHPTAIVLKVLNGNDFEKLVSGTITPTEVQKKRAQDAVGFHFGDISIVLEEKRTFGGVKYQRTKGGVIVFRNMEGESLDVAGVISHELQHLIFKNFFDPALYISSEEKDTERWLASLPHRPFYEQKDIRDEMKRRGIIPNEISPEEEKNIFDGMWVFVHAKEMLRNETLAYLRQNIFETEEILLNSGKLIEDHDFLSDEIRNILYDLFSSLVVEIERIANQGTISPESVYNKIRVCATTEEVIRRLKKIR